MAVGWTVPDVVVANEEFAWVVATWIGLGGWFPDNADQESVSVSIAQVGTTHLSLWIDSGIPLVPGGEQVLYDVAYPWFE